MRITVVGARGQLGAAVVVIHASHEVTALGRADLDITVGAAWSGDDADAAEIIVNCATAAS